MRLAAVQAVGRTHTGNTTYDFAGAGTRYIICFGESAEREPARVASAFAKKGGGGGSDALGGDHRLSEEHAHCLREEPGEGGIPWGERIPLRLFAASTGRQEERTNERTGPESQYTSGRRHAAARASIILAHNGAFSPPPALSLPFPPPSVTCGVR